MFVSEFQPPHLGRIGFGVHSPRIFLLLVRQYIELLWNQHCTIYQLDFASSRSYLCWTCLCRPLELECLGVASTASLRTILDPVVVEVNIYPLCVLDEDYLTR